MIHFRVARWFLFKPKIPIWKILDGLRLENVDIFYGHLEYLHNGHMEYFMNIWYIFTVFGVTCQEKSGNPDSIIDR
jgi:hypothetical protein